MGYIISLNWNCDSWNLWITTGIDTVISLIQGLNRLCIAKWHTFFPIAMVFVRDGAVYISSGKQVQIITNSNFTTLTLRNENTIVFLKWQKLYLESIKTRSFGLSVVAQQQQPLPVGKSFLHFSTMFITRFLSFCPSLSHRASQDWACTHIHSVKSHSNPQEHQLDM